MNIIHDTEVSTFSAKKRLLLIGGAALAVLAFIKFKKQLKNLIDINSTKSKGPFAPVNQHKKIAH